MRHEWVVRFDYGLIVPWVHREEVDGEPAIIAGGRPRQARPARAPAADGDDDRHVETFDVEAGEPLTFSLTWIPSYASPPPDDVDARLVQTTLDEQQTGRTPVPRGRAARRRRPPVAADPARC